ncbi:MAG: Fic family protein [Bacteroidales bacterium]|nr:Fic family protein [Bacteroidales bacterium]
MDDYNLIKKNYLNNYRDRLDKDLKKSFYTVIEEEVSLENFNYYFSSSAVFSSNIEGNNTDFNSFWKYKKFNIPAISKEIKKLFEDIERLLNQNLSIEESFYYASFIHLVFAKIHPFMDGNGRASRLIEKWFLASMLGEKAWYIQSEKYYFENRKNYYQNIHLGVNYYELNYDRCLPFLLILPEALK